MYINLENSAILTILNLPIQRTQRSLLRSSLILTSTAWMRYSSWLFYVRSHYLQLGFYFSLSNLVTACFYFLPKCLGYYLYVQCWIKAVRVDNFVLFLILGWRLSSLSHEICQWWGFCRCSLSCWEFPSILSSLNNFIIEEWWFLWNAFFFFASTKIIIWLLSLMLLFILLIWYATDWLCLLN